MDEEIEQSGFVFDGAEAPKDDVPGPANEQPQEVRDAPHDPAYVGQLERIREHRFQAYTNPDSLAALLSYKTSEICESALHVSRRLIDELSSGKPTTKQVRRLMPLFDLQIRLSQATAQLSRREVEAANRDFIRKQDQFLRSRGYGK